MASDSDVDAAILRDLEAEVTDAVRVREGGGRGRGVCSGEGGRRGAGVVAQFLAELFDAEKHVKRPLGSERARGACCEGGEVGVGWGRGMGRGRRGRET
jgi:hypothetical protein